MDKLVRPGSFIDLEYKGQILLVLVVSHKQVDDKALLKGLVVIDEEVAHDKFGGFRRISDHDTLTEGEVVRKRGRSPYSKKALSRWYHNTPLYGVGSSLTPDEYCKHFRGNEAPQRELEA